MERGATTSIWVLRLNDCNYNRKSSRIMHKIFFSEYFICILEWFPNFRENVLNQDKLLFYQVEVKVP